MKKKRIKDLYGLYNEIIDLYRKYKITQREYLIINDIITKSIKPK